MKLTSFLSPIFFSTALAAPPPAEQVVCGNEAPPQALENEYTAILTDTDKARQAVAPTQPINIYYHVIGKTDAQARTITSDMLRNQTNAINRGFSGSGFQFSLKAIYWVTQPSGQDWLDAGASDRYNYSSPKPSSKELKLKTQRHVGNYRDLNVYIAPEMLSRGQPSGYCRFPQNLNSNSEIRDIIETLDGCAVDYGCIPGPNARPYFNHGKNLIHEIVSSC